MKAPDNCSLDALYSGKLPHCPGERRKRQGWSYMVVFHCRISPQSFFPPSTSLPRAPLAAEPASPWETLPNSSSTTARASDFSKPNPVHSWNLNSTLSCLLQELSRYYESIYTSFSYSSRMAALELPHPQALSNPVRVHKTLTVPKLLNCPFPPAQPTGHLLFSASRAGPAHPSPPSIAAPTTLRCCPAASPATGSPYLYSVLRGASWSSLRPCAM